MSVGQWFRQFCSNIRIPRETVGKISSRCQIITRRLNLDFWDNSSSIAHSLYVGSYGRDTDIITSDIDVVMRLPYETYLRYNRYESNGQSALLQAVRSSIQKTYKTYVHGDGQVVCVDFTDGINFEVVPGFLNKDNSSFTYPDANDDGRWRVTDPRPEIAAIASRNLFYNKNLKWLARMMRAWKLHWKVPMGGLLIDTLAFHFIALWKHSHKGTVYYDWMVRDFLSYVANQDQNQRYWCAPGSNQQVYRRGFFEYKAKRCYNIALEAISKQDYPYTATSKWREIFGKRFPVRSA